MQFPFVANRAMHVSHCYRCWQQGGPCSYRPLCTRYVCGVAERGSLIASAGTSRGICCDQGHNKRDTLWNKVWNRQLSVASSSSWRASLPVVADTTLPVQCEATKRRLLYLLCIGNVLGKLCVTLRRMWLKTVPVLIPDRRASDVCAVSIYGQSNYRKA